jgi:hypothetical protein
MRGKLMFITGLAAGFVLGSRAGREKYEEITANAKKVWEHPTVQEAAGVAQAQANKLYSEGKGKLDQSKIGQKLHSGAGTSGTSTSTSTLGSSTGTSDSSLTATNDSLAGSTGTTTSTSTGTGTGTGTTY